VGGLGEVPASSTGTHPRGFRVCNAVDVRRRTGPAPTWDDARSSTVHSPYYRLPQLTLLTPEEPDL